MKVLVTGIRGQLGHDVMKELAARGIPAVGADIVRAGRTAGRHRPLRGVYRGG